MPPETLILASEWVFQLSHHCSLSFVSSPRYRAYVRWYTSSPRPLNPNRGLLARPSELTKCEHSRKAIARGVAMLSDSISSWSDVPSPPTCVSGVYWVAARSSHAALLPARNSGLLASVGLGKYTRQPGGGREREAEIRHAPPMVRVKRELRQKSHSQTLQGRQDTKTRDSSVGRLA